MKAKKQTTKKRKPRKQTRGRQIRKKHKSKKRTGGRKPRKQRKQKGGRGVFGLRHLSG